MSEKSKIDELQELLEKEDCLVNIKPDGSIEVGKTWREIAEAAEARITELEAERDHFKRVFEVQDEAYSARDNVLLRLEARCAAMREALVEVMLWVKNWDVPFLDDDEWDATQAKVDHALADPAD